MVCLISKQFQYINLVKIIFEYYFKVKYLINFDVQVIKKDWLYSNFVKKKLIRNKIL